LPQGRRSKEGDTISEDEYKIDRRTFLGAAGTAGLTGLAGCGGLLGGGEETTSTPDNVSVGSVEPTPTATRTPTATSTSTPSEPSLDSEYLIDAFYEGTDKEDAVTFHKGQREVYDDLVVEDQEVGDLLEGKFYDESGDVASEYVVENEIDEEEVDNGIEELREDMNVQTLENITDAFNEITECRDESERLWTRWLPYAGSGGSTCERYVEMGEEELEYRDVVEMFDFAQDYDGDVENPLGALETAFTSQGTEALETVFAGYQAAQKYDGENYGNELMASGLKMVGNDALEADIEGEVISDIELKHLGYELDANELPENPFRNWSDTGIDNRTLLNLDENPQDVEEGGLIHRMVSRDQNRNVQRFEIERYRENGETKIMIRDEGEKIGLDEDADSLGDDDVSLNLGEFEQWKDDEFQRIQNRFNNPEKEEEWSNRVLQLAGTSEASFEEFEGEDLRKEVLAELGEFNLEYLTNDGEFRDTVHDVNTVALEDSPTDDEVGSVALERIAMINDFDQFWPEDQGINFFQQTLGVSEDLDKLEGKLRNRAEYSGEFEFSEIDGVRRFVDDYDFESEDYSPSEELDRLISEAGRIGSGNNSPSSSREGSGGNGGDGDSGGDGDTGGGGNGGGESGGGGTGGFSGGGGVKDFAETVGDILDY
jgi:hypothetical protein